MKSNHRWPIGTIMSLESLFDGGLGRIKDMNMDTYQLGIWDAYDFDDELIEKIRTAMGDFVASSCVIGWPDPKAWNFYEGPSTLGIRPKKYRQERMECYFKAIDVVSQLGIPLITTHIGFVPEDPEQDDYIQMVKCLKQLADYSGERSIEFCLETGQETPITLRRYIEDAGNSNLGINFDTANLLLYGKANPVDAVDMFGKYVKSMHIKDGEYPTDARELGEEKPVGEGSTNFPVVLQKLADIGYQGALIIEREISGEKQLKDIEQAFNLLEKWLLDIK